MEAVDTFDVNSVAEALIMIIKACINSLLPNAKNFNCEPTQFDRPDSLKNFF